MPARYTRNPYQQDGHDFQRCRGFGVGNVDTGYHYGYPAYGSSEPNVVAQWLFGEYWDNFTGITQSGAAGFQNASNNAATIGVSAAQSAIVTTTASLSSSAAGYNFLYSYGDAYSAGKGLYLYYLTSDGKVHFEVNDNSGHLVDLGGTYALADGLIHDVKGVFTRSGTSEIFVDNVSLGTASVAAVTDAFTNTGKVSVGTSGTTGNYWLGTIYEVAVGAGVTTLGTRGPGSGVTPYNYVSSSQTGLVFHTKMQEASGDITDSKNSIVLTANGSHTYSVAGAGKGVRIYDAVSGIFLDPMDSTALDPVAVVPNQTVTGAYAGISPGIMGINNVSYTPNFAKLSSVVSALSVAANDNLVIEGWLRATVANTTSYTIFGFDPGSEAAKLIHAYVQGNAGPATFYVKSDDNTTKYAEFTLSGTLLTSDPNKLRFVLNKSGNMEVFQNGVSLGTSSATTLGGKAITHGGNTRIGRIWTGANRMLGVVYYEVRVSHNATNNSGGPGGG